jgi:signal transduction histidine kinase
LNQAQFAEWVQSHKRWVLLGMLVLLHLILLEGVPSPISRTLVMVHVGLFFLWQPFVRHERRIAPHHSIAIGLTLGAVVLWLNWWLLIVWVVLLAGIIGGKVFLFDGRAARVFYLLALSYLLCILIIILVPNVLPPSFAVADAFGTLARYVLPLIFVVMAALPQEAEPRGHAEVVDFAYSLFVVLTLAVLVLGSIASMLLRGAGYIESLLEIMLTFGVVLLFLAWVWDPRAGYSGIGAIFSRYMLTIGLPFEQWVHALSAYAQRSDDPEEFMAWACEELVRRIPWVQGGEWRSPAGGGQFGNEAGQRSEFHHDPLMVVLRTRQALTPALAWHLHVVTQLLAEFYMARSRARKLRQLSYMQAIYETGARLTHDVKNLLQSLNTLCVAAAAEGEAATPQFQALLRRQLPAIAQRLQSTLDKLQTPAMEQQDLVGAATWWDELKRRYSGEEIDFRFDPAVDGMTLPASLFDSAAENFLQNALVKRGSGGPLRIAAEMDTAAGRPRFRVTDSGAAMPAQLAAQIGHGPVASDNGLGIGLYQVAHYADMLRYRLSVANNQAGEVSFALEPAEQRGGNWG